MSRKKELILILLSDFIFINLAWSIYYYFRVETHWIKFANPPSYLVPMLVVYFYWLLIFIFSGLYQHWYVRSRFDEFASVFKRVFLGCLILFFAIFIDDFMKDSPIISRYLILIYWFILVFSVAIGRILIRGFQMRLLQKGIGAKNALIVGVDSKANELFNMILDYPRLGYKFIGYIGVDDSEKIENEIGKIESLKEIIKKEKIEVVLVASEQKVKKVLLDTINYCSDENVSVKIMPELYEIVSGMAKTQQIYGIPLIEVNAELLPFHSRFSKRIFDIIASFFILLFLLPLLILTSIIIKITSKGPIIYKQKRSGKNGKEFNVFKFRTMYPNMVENKTPIWTDKDYHRVTPFGNFLRKIRFDEILQLINVIKNDMSIVGPKPERTIFIEQLKSEIPYYTKRLSVKPGITGWAQVKLTNDDMTIEDVKARIQYDFYYIENISFSLDVRILLNTIIVIFTTKGH